MQLIDKILYNGYIPSLTEFNKIVSEFDFLYQYKDANSSYSKDSDIDFKIGQLATNNPSFQEIVNKAKLTIKGL